MASTVGIGLTAEAPESEMPPGLAADKLNQQSSLRCNTPVEKWFNVETLTCSSRIDGMTRRNRGPRLAATSVALGGPLVSCRLLRTERGRDAFSAPEIELRYVKFLGRAVDEADSQHCGDL